MLTVILRGLVACTLLAAGSCAYSGMGEVRTFTCSRSSGVCILESENRHEPTVRFPVDDLTGAEVEDYRTAYPNAPGRRAKGQSARLVLLTRSGRVPLMAEFSGIGMDVMAAQKGEIDAFVRQRERRDLRIQRDERRLAAVLGGIPFLLGLGCLASAVAEYRRWRDA